MMEEIFPGSCANPGSPVKELKLQVSERVSEWVSKQVKQACK